ncbi:MAG TPA: hemerythrin domain-containing protein [Acidimicrobiales bacterium]|nr:hemerythrin domain-containing protein [Acidimicrobiales bacterium]
MDAITLLKNDHKSVEKLFKDYEKTGDRALKTRRDLVDRMIEELSKHAAIEEQLFYPVTRETVSDIDDTVLESIEEHHIVKWLLSELQNTDVSDERFNAKVTVLIENVRHHVTEEEDEYFPKVRDGLGRKALGELGDAMAETRETASPHPHPRAPSTAPENQAAGVIAMVDRVGDTVSGVAQGGVAAVQDLVDRIRGLTPRRSGPTGSSTARRSADKVRDTAGTAVDEAVASVRAARDRGEDVVEEAKGAADDVAKTARRGARRTEAATTGSKSSGSSKRKAG